MKNSLTPLVLLIATVTVALWWISRGPVIEAGAEGPSLAPGIFRLPKDARKLVGAADLHLVRQVTDTLAAATQVRPVGMVPETWRTVIVASEDRHPLAASVVLGLAERLTAHGCVAIVATADSPPFPMAADLRITIGAEGEDLPRDTAAPYHAKLAVTWTSLDFPQEHPAQRRQADISAGLISQGLMVIDCQATPGSARPTWAAWYAAVGRTLAGEVLERLSGGELPPLLDKTTGKMLTNILPRADWGGSLHLPPQCEGLRWLGACQQELVRGWTGTFQGAKSGHDTASRAELERRLRNGHWQQSGEDLLWSRDQNDALWWFSASPAETGYTVACWQERPAIAVVFSTWLDEAKGNDVMKAALARRQLARYRRCEGIPADLRMAADHLQTTDQ